MRKEATPIEVCNEVFFEFCGRCFFAREHEDNDCFGLCRCCRSKSIKEDILLFYVTAISMGYKWRHHLLLLGILHHLLLSLHLLYF